MHRVFVYGTLKKGQPNHHWFSKTTKGISKFICEGKTCTKYPLIIGTKYNIPFLLYAPGKYFHFFHHNTYHHFIQFILTIFPFEFVLNFY